MFRLLLMLLFSSSCAPQPQSPWKCLSGVKISNYKSAHGEKQRFEVNYDDKSARVYGRILDLHEDTVRYADTQFSVEPSRISFGTILIDADIFELKNWVQNSNTCVKTKQFSRGASIIAVVECSENKEKLGFLTYTFDSKVGVTRIQHFRTDGTVVDWHLFGNDGLGKMCRA